MATPMNRSAFPYQFDKEIAKMFFAKYADYPKEFDKIAKVENFPAGKTYTEAEISGLGALRAMGEGEAISYDVPVEGHKKSIQTVKFGLGFQKTEEMSADELFGMSKRMSDSLSRSAAICADTNFWNLFNNGFATTQSWDAKYVFAANHVTMKSGETISNLGAADLSQTSLEAAFQYYDDLVDEAGIKLNLKPNKLVIPTELKWLANDLLKSTGRVWNYPDSSGQVMGGMATGLSYVAANTYVAPGNGPLLNGVNPNNGIVDNWSVFVSKYLTDPDAWFLLSDQQDARFLWKKRPTMTSTTDFDTDNEMYKIVMRFAVAVFDWRGMYGSPGA
jgi:hypothetical protein